MGLIAGVTFPDAVLLVSDELVETFLVGSDQPIGENRNTDKLEEVSGQIAAVRDGVTVPAAEIINRLRGRDYGSPAEVRDQLQAATTDVWESEIADGARSLGDAGGVGVLVGGLAGGEPFITAILRHPHYEDGRDVYMTGAWAIWAGGLGSEEAHERLVAEISQVLGGVLGQDEWPPESERMNALVAFVAAPIILEFQTSGPGRSLFDGSEYRTVLIRAGYEQQRRRMGIERVAEADVPEELRGVLDRGVGE